MAQVESIDEVMAKKGSIEHLWKIIDPENRYPYKTCLDGWYRMSLTEQRRMYLYLLYRKWRGEKFYGTPYDIVTNCHPYPTNWNGRPMLERLIKDGTPMVRAFFDNSFGIYTQDEAKVWDMTKMVVISKRVGKDQGKTREKVGKK